MLYSPYYNFATISDVQDFFVGRTKEIDFLKQELITNKHSVIVFGPPGVCKTALASFFAETNCDSFPRLRLQGSRIIYQGETVIPF